jgi:hypothetical protein
MNAFDGFSALIYAWFDENDDGHAELLTIYEWRYVAAYWWSGALSARRRSLQ